jgi:hypothetical protein
MSYDERCDCCGRHFSELQPFNRTEGNSSDYFIKNSRPFCTHEDEEINKALEEARKEADFEGSLIAKYGKEKAEELIRIDDLLSYFYGESWECRDCIILNDVEYRSKHAQRTQLESKQAELVFENDDSLLDDSRRDNADEPPAFKH